MPTRRGFLRGAVVVTTATAGAMANRMAMGSSPNQGDAASSAGVATAPTSRPTALPTGLPDINSLKPAGRFYDATIPDTFDLAERAMFSVNNLTHNVDPNDYYYNYQSIRFGAKDPGPVLQSRTWNITPKNMRALPWMRTMCGSDEFLDRQAGMIAALLSNVREDGLLYYPADSDGPAKNSSYPDVNGILALACENHYNMDGHRQWLDWIQLLATGLDKVAIRVQDRAYFPPECSIDPAGNWHWTLRGGKAELPYVPPQEPYLDQQGLEGTVKFEQAYAIRALVRAHRYAPNQTYSELLQRFLRFCLKPGMWENVTLEGYLGNEHGIFGGHFHGNTAALLALLDVAQAEKNVWLKEFVREAYEHAIHTGVVQVGWFPGWIMPTKYGRPASVHIATEGDSIGEMIELAVRLADAGIGEYWDDVDSMVRNQLAEQQLCSRKLLSDMSGGAPGIEDFVGGFTQIFSDPPNIASAIPAMYGCCSANGSIGLYYAWHGITRFHQGVATVNLFLNRASEWMDIDSYLPYEGKVELHNKKAKTALVRIPRWVEMEDVRSYVDNRMTKPSISGRYFIFDGLSAGATIRMEFPNPERTDSFTIDDKRYRITFRGSTVLDLEPRVHNPGLVALYQRNQFKATQAPSRKTRRFVAENVLPLQ